MSPHTFLPPALRASVGLVGMGAVRYARASPSHAAEG